MTEPSQKQTHFLLEQAVQPCYQAFGFFQMAVFMETDLLSLCHYSFLSDQLPALILTIGQQKMYEQLFSPFLNIYPSRGKLYTTPFTVTVAFMYIFQRHKYKKYKVSDNTEMKCFSQLYFPPLPNGPLPLQCGIIKRGITSV